MKSMDIFEKHYLELKGAGYTDAELRRAKEFIKLGYCIEYALELALDPKQRWRLVD